MKRIKVTVAPSDKGFSRQIPHGGFVLNDLEFHINEDDFQEADIWVVCYHYFPDGELKCKVAPQNTVFVTWEPESVCFFSRRFLKQFGKVISCQKGSKHPNVVRDQPGLSWHIGMTVNNGINNYNRTYDDFATSQPEKTKLISVISSSKSFTKGHRERLEFVRKLKEHFGDSLDVFGRGLCDFEDKWDVIAPYKYHICIENCSQPYYFSEKLADSFLGNSFPFYYGCTNVGRFFSNDSYQVIDIKKPEESIAIIERCIASDISSVRKEAVEESKRRVLDEYNFFMMISKNIETMDVTASKSIVTIKDITHFELERKAYKLMRIVREKIMDIFHL